MASRLGRLVGFRHLSSAAHAGPPGHSGGDKSGRSLLRTCYSSQLSEHFCYLIIKA